MIVYPQLSDIQKAFPDLDPALLGHDIAYPAMLKFLPVGFVGLMVGGLVAANSSTILTHLNWGASYLVHDFYRRFIKTDATERHYVAAGRVATLLLFVCSSGLVFVLDSAKDAFDVILQIGAGHGPAVPGALVLVARERVVRGRRDDQLVPRVARAARPREERRALQHPRGADAHDRVHHRVLGGHRVPRAADRSRRARGLLPQDAAGGPGLGAGPARPARRPPATTTGAVENIPMAILGWVSGCTLVWSALFTHRQFPLRPHRHRHCCCSSITVVSGLTVIWVVRTLWAGDDASQQPA